MRIYFTFFPQNTNKNNQLDEKYLEASNKIKILEKENRSCHEIKRDYEQCCEDQKHKIADLKAQLEASESEHTKATGTYYVLLELCEIANVLTFLVYI